MRWRQVLGFFDRHIFLLKRLHSLSGLVPVGVFLVFHLSANAYAIHGEEAYEEHAAIILGLPYLYLIEIFFLALPIIFHAALGIFITFTGQVNVVQQNRFRNWMYFFQRVSGIFLVVYIAVHVYGTRFNPERKDGLFQLMANKLDDPAYLAFYVLGVLAATFHFSNGLWGFLVTWGITLSPKAQRISTYVCAAIFVALSFVGVNSLFAFNGGGIRFLNP